MLTVGSLFAGIGGFDLGLERAKFVWDDDRLSYQEPISFTMTEGYDVMTGWAIAPGKKRPGVSPAGSLKEDARGRRRHRWNDQLGAEVDDAIHYASETRDMGARLSRAG